MRNLNLADAKRRLNIFDLWRHFGFEGEPKASCKSPFREDHKPSFSVSPNGCLWNDFATGDAGDQVDFFQRASGLPMKQACRKFIELAGGRITPVPHAAPTPRNESRRLKPSFPDFVKGKPVDLARLSALRSVSLEAVALAHARGLILFATLHSHQSWIVTDSQRFNAQARRLDGLPWEHLESCPKAWTMPGSWAAWPVGIKEAQDFPAIALCEGGPDLLAAFHFIVCEDKETTCGSVTMLGAGLAIHSDALPLFVGKRVRIFGHADPDGQAATERWAEQLTRAGATVDAFSFTGLRKVDETPVKDLNDLTSVHADDFEAHRELWEMMP